MKCIDLILADNQPIVGICMKDKLIVEERMKQFNKDILHWKNYDFVVINDNLEKCYNEVSNLIESKINKINNTYDVQLIERHINQLIT